MRTAFISHPDCLAHDTGKGHPESARRLYAIEDALVSNHVFDFLKHFDAPEVTRNQLLRVHTADYLALVESQMPRQGYAHLDPDTVVCPSSPMAAARAAGAAVLAVDLIMQETVQNAFCSVRPPGHHAEADVSMGFCIYNNIAVGAAHALEAYGLNRVAILDFDVHHGNGTEEIFLDDDRVMFCSTFQHPFYPNTPLLENNARRVSVPLPATAKSDDFRSAVNGLWLPALERFQPEMIFVSAGFDGHVDDEMSGVSLTDADFQWVTEQIVQQADRHASGRVVSILEGGYELRSLARSVVAHVRVLMNLH